MFCNTEEGLKKEIKIAKQAKELGVPAEVLSAGDVKKMEPGLDIEIVGATYYPKDALMHPDSLMNHFKG